MLVAETPSWCCFHMFLLVFAKRGLLDVLGPTAIPAFPTHISINSIHLFH